MRNVAWWFKRLLVFAAVSLGILCIMLTLYASTDETGYNTLTPVSMAMTEAGQEWNLLPSLTTSLDDVDPTKLSQSRKLIILAYQRVGSSFFGKIFDLNPEVFYVYEPLDAVYTHLYGTHDGYNIPSDFIMHGNGTTREIPELENTAVRQFLRSLLDCDFSALPSTFFLHYFWHHLADLMPGSKPYASCLRRLRAENTTRQCRESTIPGQCPQRFGTDWPRQNYCQEELNKLRTNPETSDNSSFGRFQECMQSALVQIAPCVSQLRDKCLGAQLRVVKTVRATAAQVAPLVLDPFDSIRMIHLHRDPVPVVNSRSKNPTFRGWYSSHPSMNLSKEASVYCSAVAHDFDCIQRHLAGTGDVLEIDYKDIVTDALDTANRSSIFGGVSLSDNVRNWLVKDATGRRTSKLKAMNGHQIKKPVIQDTSQKQRRKAAAKEQILAVCKDYYKLVNNSTRSVS